MQIYRDFTFDNTKITNSLILPNTDVTHIPPQQKGALVYGTDGALHTSNGITWSSSLISGSGEYIPTIEPNNQPHTIDAVYQGFFMRVGNMVTAQITYLISPSVISLRATFSDVISLPPTLLPSLFVNQFQVTGQITCNMGDDSNTNYGHGAVFSLTSTKDIEVFYSFVSLAGTEVYISVSVTYKIS